MINMSTDSNTAGSPQNEASKAESKGEDFLATLERKINVTENIVIAVLIVVALGFITLIFELGFIVHDSYVAKEVGYQYLVEKIHDQDIAIKDLQRVSTIRKK
jgi:hypothetical protein